MMILLVLLLAMLIPAAEAYLCYTSGGSRGGGTVYDALGTGCTEGVWPREFTCGGTNYVALPLCTQSPQCTYDVVCTKIGGGI
jgi:hypothetical protein